MNTNYFYTGVRATESEEHDMLNPLPYMVIGGSVTESSAEQIHRMALARGLPEIRGYYGYDFKEHEYIRLLDALDSAPDARASRRIADVLGE